MVNLRSVLAGRFAGLDVQYRSNGCDWPGLWRVRIVATGKDREYHGLTTYGQTEDEAVHLMLQNVELMDQEARRYEEKKREHVEIFGVDNNIIARLERLESRLYEVFGAERWRTGGND